MFDVHRSCMVFYKFIPVHAMYQSRILFRLVMMGPVALVTVTLCYSRRISVFVCDVVIIVFIIALM